MENLKVNNIVEKSVTCRKTWKNHAVRMGKDQWLEVGWNFKCGKV
jgi:hypothetical protein